VEKAFYLTSPLYYVNAKPHIGSAYTTIVCDTIARFHKLMNKECVFLTGVDEHGGKIEESAKKNKISPKEHCDSITQKFKSLWNALEIKYDFFARTSSKNHEKVVEAFFLLIKKNSDIYQGSYHGLYCLACEDFKNKRELIEGKYCPIHKTTAVKEYSEKNYFFRLSKYTEKILKLIEETDLIQPSYRKREVLFWIKEGLKDFPISRNSVSWGVKVPGDPQQTIYVWFDALIGYLTPIVEFLYKKNFNCSLDGVEKIDPKILRDLIESSEILPANVHVIGKDILRFHAVYWTGMLLSAGFRTPKKIFGHGFITKDGEKMGKTLGNTVCPEELINKFGRDATRFYFLFVINFGQDGDFSEKNFIEISNSFLANKIGNLFSRVIKLIKKNFDSELPLVEIDFEQSEILKQTSELPEFVKKDFENLEISSALKRIFDLVEILNINLTEKRPWNLLKSKDSLSQKMAIVCLRETMESLRIISCLLYPFIPSLSKKMLSVFSLKEPSLWEDLGNFKFLEQNPKIKDPGILFNRFENRV